MGISNSIICMRGFRFRAKIKKWVCKYKVKYALLYIVLSYFLIYLPVFQDEIASSLSKSAFRYTVSWSIHGFQFEGNIFGNLLGGFHWNNTERTFLLQETWITWYHNVKYDIHFVDSLWLDESVTWFPDTNQTEFAFKKIIRRVVILIANSFEICVCEH